MPTDRVSSLDSSFRVWLHPRRAFSELEELRLQLSLTSDERVRHAEEIAGRDAELAAARQRLEESERARRRLEADLATSHAKCDAQADSLRELEESAKEMERMAGQLEKMQSMRDMMAGMREDYEARIARLERQLWSSHSGGLQYTDPARELPDPSESELLEPGESPFRTPEPIPMEGKRQPRVSPAADDTDWLLPLPD